MPTRVANLAPCERKTAMNNFAGEITKSPKSCIDSQIVLQMKVFSQ